MVATQNSYIVVKIPTGSTTLGKDLATFYKSKHMSTLKPKNFTPRKNKGTRTKTYAPPKKKCTRWFIAVLFIKLIFLFFLFTRAQLHYTS